ncbi:hypothetical protein [Deinococcus navajonensis]|uniref:Uncharacterized protein n=1 Tax=Deinococcus navajonensis TaxID=309884 RepID=A0ABV8XRB5_9DEIO
MTNPNPDTTKTDTPKTEAKPKAADTRTVKVNYDNDKVADGTGFIHPTGKQVIAGKKSVAVPADDWTDQMIRDKVLTEVGK